MKQEPSAASGTPEDARTVTFSAPSGGRPVQAAASSVANPDAPVPYEFRHEIARGGMGSILEAQDRKLGRTVAVKVMLSEMGADADQRQRFINEAAVLARLAHPNIVPVHDLGRDTAGRLFYTMKLVHGRTLQAILNGIRDGAADARHYTLDRLLTVFRKVCDALAFAHSRGIIHRDLKPENIMVGEFGEVLVMDWGLAKNLNAVPKSDDTPVTDSFAETIVSKPGTDANHKAALRRIASGGGADSGMTLEGAIMGTPQYMSPEQAQGRIAEMDARSDIFSLGGILYAILTLRPPVEGKTLDEVLQKVTSGSITPPSAFGASSGKGARGAKGEVLEAMKIRPLPHCPRGRVPAALSAVVMKALCVKREDRYQRVAALSVDVEAYQNGFATSAEQAGMFKQLGLLIRRHKGVAGTAFAAWFIITALAVWFVINLRVSERKATRNAEIATANEQTAKAAEAVAVKEKEATRQALAKSALALAEAARREGNTSEMQAALNDVPKDLRDSTWTYLLAQSDTSIARVATGAGVIEGMAGHPRLPGVFAVADNGNKVTLIEVRTGRRLLEFTMAFQPETSGKCRLAFSPDGERIAVGRSGDGGIVIHSARDGKKLQEWAAPGARRVEFSHDGSLLLQTEVDAKFLSVWDTATGQLRWRYEPQKGGVAGTFTPDGQQVLTDGDPDRLRLVNARDGSLFRPLSVDTTYFNRTLVMAIRPNGKMAVIGSHDGKVKGVDLQDGHVTFTLRPHERAFARLAYTPDGARFVTVAGLADGRQMLQLWGANTGAPLQSLLGGTGGITDAAVHPLSGELLVGGSKARVWNLVGTPQKWTLPMRVGRTQCIAFWGSDDVVFAGTVDFPCALQTLQSGTPDVLWKPAGVGFNRPSVSADGRFAAIGWLGASDPYPVVLLRHPGPEIEQVASFKLTGQLDFLRLSPTGDRLVAVERDAAGTNRQSELFDTATGTQPVQLDRKDINRFWDLGWLSGGQRLVGLVTAKADRGDPRSEEWVVIWDAASGKVIQSVTNGTAMDVLAVAPDGRRFAEAGADKLVRIRDAETLAVLQEFRAHDAPLIALAWHPTRPILATASADLSIRLWNLETGRRLEDLRGPVTPTFSLAFSPSGRRLGCAGDSDVTRIWEPQSLSDQAAAPKTKAGD